MKWTFFFLFALSLVFFGCEDPPEPIINNTPALPEIRVQETISPNDYGLYFAGYFAGTFHNHPSVMFDPELEQFIVSAKNFQQNYDLSDFEQVKTTYKSVLLNAGYLEKKQADDSEIVWVDGKQLVYRDLNALFMEGGEVKKKFTSKQYNYLKDLRPSDGFKYLNGTDESPYFLPLIYASGNGLTFVREKKASSWKHEQLDSIFAHYKLHIDSLSLPIL